MSFALNSRLILQYSLFFGALVAARHRSVKAQSKLSEMDDSRPLKPNSVAAPQLAATTQSSQAHGIVRTELAVKMHCESCARHVREVLEGQHGVSGVQVDLPSETVVVSGSFLASDLVAALAKAGRDARIVGSGSVKTGLVPAEVGLEEEWSAAVGEFKGKMYGHGDVHGVIRIVQTDPNTCSVESELAGLKIGSRYAWHAHEFGDLRSLPRTAGKRLPNSLLGKGVAGADGIIKHHARIPLHVWELIGRSIVLYENDQAVCGTVVARSAGIGANTGKRLCTCDGTVIWEAKY